MNRVGGKIILWLLILALIIFTAIRTLHFLQQTFPPELGYVAYLGLAAFDVGILGWLYYASHSAEGASQRAVAYGMIFVCMAGVIITTIADMVMVSAQNGLTKLPPQWSTIGLWGVIIVIIMNVVAGILVHLCDPKHVRHLAMETARDRIHGTVLAHISAQADTIAPQIAEHTARHWANQVIHEMTGSIPGSYQAPQLPASRVVDSDPVELEEEVPVSSRNQVLDPTDVRGKIDNEVKPLERKSWRDKIKDVVDFSTPETSPKQTQKIEQVPIEESPVEQKKVDTPELPDNYLDWSDKQWKQAKEQLDPVAYNELFDDAFPPEGLKPTPKKKVASKRPASKKKVSRRKVIGMGKQGG